MEVFEFGIWGLRFSGPRTSNIDRENHSMAQNERFRARAIPLLMSMRFRTWVQNFWIEASGFSA